MIDFEYRWIFTMEGRHLVGVVIYATDPDGQGRIVETFDVGPFDTLYETMQKAVVACRRDALVMVPSA